MSMLHMVSGYIPDRITLPLPLGRYSFPIPLRAGGSVSPGGWLYTMSFYLRMVVGLSIGLDVE